jgi:prepilin signal peptidase PulO-like enzyme (type II secretory pathway)
MILLLTAIIFIIFMLTLSWMDFHTLKLPDELTLSLLWLGLGFNAFKIWVVPQEAILGSITGYLAFWSVSRAYLGLRKKPGLGLGDAKLLAAIGAWLGWKILPEIVLLATLLNLLWAWLLFLTRPEIKTTLFKCYFPFAPALAISSIAMMLLKVIRNLT